MALPARYLEFLASDIREDRYLVRYQPIDRDGNTVEFLQSTDGFGTKTADSISAKQFEPQLLEPFRFSRSIELENLSGIIPGAQGGQLRHQNYHGNLDSWRSQYYFDGRPVTVYHGGSSEATGELAFDEYGEIYKGVVSGQPAVGLTEVVVDLAPTDTRLDFPYTETVLCGLPWMLWSDGATLWADVGTSSSFNFTAFPLSFEVRTLPNGIPGAATTIMTRGSLTVDGYGIRYGSDGKVKFDTSQSGASQTSSTSRVINSQERHSICFDIDAAGVCRVYIDGVFDCLSATHIAPAASTRHLKFFQNDAGAGFFNGAINEVRIWNIARGPASISDTAQRTLTAAERLNVALVAYWPFDDGFGATTAAEASGEGTAATLHGSVWYRALEGAADMEGQRHPQALGASENVPGFLVEANPPIWQVHARRMALGTIAKEGGVPRDLGNAGVEFTSWPAFLAATTVGSTFDVLRTSGGTFVRLAIPPQLDVTFDVPGDDTDGTHRTTMAPLARMAITTFGPDPFDDATELDTDAWDLAATQQAFGMNLWFADDRTVRQVADYFLKSGGYSVWQANVSGLYTIRRFDGVADAVANATRPIQTLGIDDIVGIDAPIKARAPVWITRLKCRHNYHRFDTTKLSAELNVPAYDDARRFLLQDWMTMLGPNLAVRKLRKQARELLISESAHSTTRGGRREAQRLTALYDGEEHAVQIQCLPMALQFDLLDPVYLDLEFDDEDGQPMKRLDSGPDEAFCIFAIEPDPQSGVVRVLLYREES
ncbi:MAG: LamG domain-containing protein [Thermoanaerobaculia bacterium]